MIHVIKDSFTIDYESVVQDFLVGSLEDLNHGVDSVNNVQSTVTEIDDDITVEHFGKKEF